MLAIRIHVEWGMRNEEWNATGMEQQECMRQKCESGMAVLDTRCSNRKIHWWIANEFSQINLQDVSQPQKRRDDSWSGARFALRKNVVTLSLESTNERFSLICALGFFPHVSSRAIVASKSLTKSLSLSYCASWSFFSPAASRRDSAYSHNSQRWREIRSLS